LTRQSALAVRAGSWRQLPASLREVRAVPGLVPLVVMQALAALAVGATSALLVVLAERAYSLNGAGYGAWLAVVGGGALVGPLLVPALSRLSPSRSVPTAYLIRGAGDVGLGLLSNGLAGGALLFAYGLTHVLGNRRLSDSRPGGRPAESPRPHLRSLGRRLADRKIGLHRRWRRHPRWSSGSGRSSSRGASCWWQRRVLAS
jgi:hypothetical protein